MLRTSNRKWYCDIDVVVKKRGVAHEIGLREWLMDNVDPECYDAEDWGAVDGDFDLRRIWFQHRQDAMIFALKWS